MDIIDMARASGMAVTLEGRIGREEYQSVCGSLSALQRFAEAVRQGVVQQSGHQTRAVAPHSQSVRSVRSLRRPARPHARRDSSAASPAVSEHTN
ncbi:hypothetical protein R69746_02726 [Paraburkholderia aspalathi]|uniref:hypothetical protein n=1 Tax=Paraburkholderia aspalathi TaxID=1324617 RepID=UPI00190AB702|nr:hypothetical protein [Paraburkholderia aspalathi]MBK3839050.1 hypothetical protein [Paraburkholderia aspalathi]CAE6745880.1 hypothetical protein R69746_02726 [Paraburkholderia aspalathi]